MSAPNKVLRVLVQILLHIRYKISAKNSIASNVFRMSVHLNTSAPVSFARFFIL